MDYLIMSGLTIGLILLLLHLLIAKRSPRHLLYPLKARYREDVRLFVESKTFQKTTEVRLFDELRSQLPLYGWSADRLAKVWIVFLEGRGNHLGAGEVLLLDPGDGQVLFRSFVGE